MIPSDNCGIIFVTFTNTISWGIINYHFDVVFLSMIKIRNGTVFQELHRINKLCESQQTCSRLLNNCFNCFRSNRFCLTNSYRMIWTLYSIHLVVIFPRYDL